MNWTSILCPEERQALVEPASCEDISSSSARSALSQLISHQAVPTSCYYSNITKSTHGITILDVHLIPPHMERSQGQVGYNYSWPTVSEACVPFLQHHPILPTPFPRPAAQQAQCQLLLPWLRTIARSVL